MIFAAQKEQLLNFFGSTFAFLTLAPSPVSRTSEEELELEYSLSPRIISQMRAPRTMQTSFQKSKHISSYGKLDYGKAVISIFRLTKKLLKNHLKIPR